MAEDSDTPQSFTYVSLDPYAPIPESSPSSYTPGKVEERLKYVNRRMKARDITPRSEIFLQLYREAIENALEATNEADRQSCYVRIYRYDRFIEENFFLRNERTQQQEEIEDRLLKLKRLEYYLRYGDYLGRELNILKDAAAIYQTENHGELRQYWTTIAAKMKKERTLFDKTPMRKINTIDFPTLRAIWMAAMAVKLSRDRVEWVIERYAYRNGLVHSSITQLLQAGKWNELARVLYHDAKDLAVVIPPGMEKDIEHMSAVISSLRSTYYTVNEGDEDDPDTWWANEEASQYRQALRKQPDNAKNKKAELVEKMVKRANDAAKNRAKRAKLVERAILGKRKASQPFPLGEKMLAKKNREMEKIVGIQKQVSKRESELEKLYQARDKAVDELGDVGEEREEPEEAEGDGAEGAASSTECPDTNMQANQSS